MQIAILGAGFAGLSAAWYLCQKGVSVTLFSSEVPSASALSAGLIHPYTGLHGKLNPLGKEGLKKTLELIEVSENALGRSVILSKGILRVATTEAQNISFKKAEKSYDDILWRSKEECQKMIRGMAPLDGVFITSGLSINAALYLEGLKLAALKKGLIISNEKVQNVESLSPFDATLLCLGANTPFKELLPYNIHAVKGQLLELSWPKDLPPLPHSLIGEVYIAMHEGGEHCTVGATYEHEFFDEKPEEEKAIRELLPKAIALYPPLAKSSVVGVKAALRASMPGRTPLGKQIGEKLYALTGLGSRGLLYHAYYANKLVNEILI